MKFHKSKKSKEFQLKLLNMLKELLEEESENQRSLANKSIIGEFEVARAFRLTMAGVSKAFHQEGFFFSSNLTSETLISFKEQIRKGCSYHKAIERKLREEYPEHLDGLDPL